MGKNIFKDIEGNIHFGVNAPAGFQTAMREDIDKVLENLEDRKLWRCNVCNDLQISVDPLKECPTCNAENAYVVIDLNEFKKLIEIL
jgi:rubrerythrin